MKLEHLAIWVKDLELMKSFYMTYFGAVPNQKYENLAKGFESYFLNIGTGARLEIMKSPYTQFCADSKNKQLAGLAHLAISLGTKDRVDQLTATLQRDGFTVLDGPRTTGDGYYESLVLDPEENRIELTL